MNNKYIPWPQAVECIHFIAPAVECITLQFTHRMYTFYKFAHRMYTLYDFLHAIEHNNTHTQLHVTCVFICETYYKGILILLILVLLQ